MDFQYLKDEQHYIDRYDLHTIEECLDYYFSIKKGFEEKRNSDEFKKYSQEKFDREVQKVLNLLVNTLTGERYRNKDKTIQEWIDRDRKEQEKYDRAVPYPAIPCKECKSPTKVSNKDLLNSYEENSQVLFMFRCTKCNKGQAFYEDGTEWIYDPPKCPKCNSVLNSDHKDVNEVMSTTYSCPKCSYKKENVYDFKKSREEREKQETIDKKMLAEYREVFCLPEKEGQEYLELTEAMEVGHEVYEEEMRKYDSPIYQRSVQLKKTSIIELEKLLTELLEKEKYIKLSFDKPEMGQQVIVPFTVQDSDSSRKENISTNDLQKLIKDALEDTNWRLMSDGINYRLGYLTGRLKGYEGEEAMLELAGKKKEQKPPQIDTEKRRKHEHSNVVQLARLSGEMKGVENRRKRRLEEEPEGFFLEESEGPLTCAICRETTPANKIWWTIDAIRCADCWRNIKEGVIPPLTWDHDNEVWIKDWQMKSEYSIQPMTRKKMEKDKLLHGRHLKREDGTIYCTVYLLDENHEFFKNHPKKPEQDIKLYWSDEQKSLMLDVKKIDYSKILLKNK